MKNNMTVLMMYMLLSCMFPAAAGNLGDFYDNRDGDHAKVNTAAWPEVVYISSGYSYQSRVIPDSVVVGNASLAYTSGLNWSSLGRYSYMNSYGAVNAYNQYRNNNCYWHPEHRDHDTTDFFHGMTPCFGISQGSSGSEKDEVMKWFDALDGFKTPVKDILRNRGLLMPVIQMLSRWTRAGADSVYVTGSAHPNAYDNSSNQAAMRAMAAGIDTNTIPPFAGFRVVEETYTGSDRKKHFGISLAEQYWDTPVSAARMFLGTEYQKRAVLKADSSFDVNGHPLTYHWRVLRGDPAHVSITPLNGDTSEVEVIIDYHPNAVIEGTSLKSNLVVVGLFVHNGYYFSPPAFFTSYTLDNEVRTYDTAAGVLLKAEYNTHYVYPRLAYPKSWDADTFYYDQTGQLTGWQRSKADSTWEFVPEGYLVIHKDPDSTVTRVQDVIYSNTYTDPREYTWRVTGNVFDYVPANPVTAGRSVPAAENRPDIFTEQTGSGLMITVTGLKQPADISIADTQGKIVFNRRRYTGKGIRCNLTVPFSGVSIVRVRTDTYSILKKVLITGR